MSNLTDLKLAWIFKIRNSFVFNLIPLYISLITWLSTRTNTFIICTTYLWYGTIVAFSQKFLVQNFLSGHYLLILSLLLPCCMFGILQISWSIGHAVYQLKGKGVLYLVIISSCLKKPTVIFNLSVLNPPYFSNGNFLTTTRQKLITDKAT